jgi:hypothetical protein
LKALSKTHIKTSWACLIESVLVKATLFQAAVGGIRNKKSDGKIKREII